MLAVRASGPVPVALGDEAPEAVEVRAQTPVTGEGVADRSLCHAEGFTEHLRSVLHVETRHIRLPPLGSVASRMPRGSVRRGY